MAILGFLFEAWLYCGVEWAVADIESVLIFVVLDIVNFIVQGNNFENRVLSFKFIFDRVYLFNDIPDVHFWAENRVNNDSDVNIT